MTKEQRISPNSKTLGEALLLAEEILRNIELSETALYICLLKASRLARLLNDQDHQLVFEYEASGYPTTSKGIPPEVWRIARIAGRVYQSIEKDKDGEKVVERANITGIEALEERISMNKSSISAAQDPNVSISSANPHQFVGMAIGNSEERRKLRESLSEDTALLARRRGYLHRYISLRYGELRFSGLADDIFSRIRTSVDQRIGETVPKAVQKLSAVYENLRSDNPEDWANAVHSCRRVLQDLADALYPPRPEITKIVNGSKKAIKLGPDNYINRLISYIEENSSSDRFNAIVGSNLAFIGDRLEATFKAAQKGSHAEISTRVEADRYVVYTYMLVSDILSLITSNTSYGKTQATENEDQKKSS